MAVHALWQDRSLLLWGHPAARGVAPPADLRDHVGQLSSDGLLASVAQDANLALWLPTDDQGPVTSCIEPMEALTLARADVPALQFAPADAIDLLLSLPLPIPDDCGDSLRFWSQLARFVVDCIRLQKFYPAARRSNSHHSALWRLRLVATETDALEKFALTMPPVCQAIVGDESTPLERIDAFLGATADALIRRAAANDPFFTRVHAQAITPDAPQEVRLLSALLAESPLIPGDSDENAALVDQVQLWTSRLTGAPPATGWQLTFKLIEPPDEADEEIVPWRVLLRMTSFDEGRTIDAEKVWADASPLSALHRLQTELRGVLKAELGRAAEIFPPLEPLVHAPMPTELELSSMQAQQFLRQWAPQLKARSFGIELPSWADNLDRRLSLVMALRPSDEHAPDDFASRQGFNLSAGPRMGLDSVLAFDWRISLGGVELSTDDFQSLVRRQTPLVKLAGRWVELDADAAANAHAFLLRHGAGETTLGQAFRTAFATSRDDASAPTIELSGASWVKDLLEQLPAMRAPDVNQPLDFLGTLRPYQLRGLQWLAFLDMLGIGGCLADDMGLGKTIQLIALLLYERSTSSGVTMTPRPSSLAENQAGDDQASHVRSMPASPSPMPENGATQASTVQNLRSQPPTGTTLLFAPTSVVGNWVRELERFSPNLRVMLHHGPQRTRGQAFVDVAAQHDVVITSYAAAHRDQEDLARVHWHRIALDEAQKIKNPSAASSIAIRSLTSPRRVALTGTPIENHLSELWSIMDVLNPGLLGSAREFRERFAVPIEKLLDKDRSEHLRRMIRPFVLRRSKSDPQIASDLPDKIEMKVYCNLTVEQAAMYERATSEMLTQIDAATGIRRRGLILAILTRLKQICDHPALLEETPGPLNGRSGKCERLLDMLEEVIEEGESALVFTQYAQMGTMLQRLLTQRFRVPIHYLHGGTPQKQRDEMVNTFQTAGVPAIFILSLRAGGLGLNLTAASHVFHFDRWWNPAVENQATDRAHRIGQLRRVQVHQVHRSRHGRRAHRQAADREDASCRDDRRRRRRLADRTVDGRPARIRETV